MLVWIILFSLSGTVGVLIAVSAFLLFSEKVQNVLIPCLISYAVGTLLAAALMGLMPHALEDAGTRSVLSTVLLGIIVFFLLEKLVLWRHCHDVECEVHAAAGDMILIGDTIHNSADGVVIAASFLVSVPLGVIAALSVIAHEIPQEVGDFAILLHSGYTKRRALSLNILSSLSTVVAAVIAYYALEVIEAAVPYVMAVSAAGFLYIALADLSPELHSRVDLTYSARQFLLMLAGVATIVLLLQIHVH
ncbi:MAG: ZIP family metal transporter [Theionarchaea archaeon]|nr:ZIP family metal transporter [Theionarchaea archaeon]